MTSTNEQERIKNSIQKTDTIEFYLDIPDKDYPKIKWSIYGLPETNEIAVKVSAGKLMYYSARESSLLSPGMSERMFGLDISDQKLAKELSDKLWDIYQLTLISEI